MNSLDSRAGMALGYARVLVGITGVIPHACGGLLQKPTNKANFVDFF
jgi:hypothetical protein